MNTKTIDAEILEKYTKNGPRYTSYPSANVFSTNVSQKSYRIALTNSRRISLYIHIPFCKSACLYCACNVIYTRDKKVGREYIEVLRKEIDMVGALASQAIVEEVHLGGGTPSFLDPETIFELMKYLREGFAIDRNPRFSIELDPRVTTKEHIEVLRKSGFTRASLGIQDMNARVQRGVNRIQSKALIEQCVEMLSEAGFTSLNFDLIYGLPFQSVDTMKETIDFVLTLAPDRVSFFNFAYLPTLKVHQKALKVDTFPITKQKIAMLALAIQTFCENGYEFIGMDHFAKKSDPLAIAHRNGSLHRNFQGYALREDLELIGLGVSSIGSLKTGYFQNCKDLHEYEERISQGLLPIERGHLLTPDDGIRRQVIMDLMCNRIIHFQDFEKANHVEFHTYFSNELRELRQLAAEGLCIIDESSIQLTDKGRFLVRNVAMIFDAYLTQKTLQVFSKTV